MHFTILKHRFFIFIRITKEKGYSRFTCYKWQSLSDNFTIHIHKIIIDFSYLPPIA